jgi:hypothetical protein
MWDMITWFLFKFKLEWLVNLYNNTKKY